MDQGMLHAGDARFISTHVHSVERRDGHCAVFPGSVYGAMQ